MKALVGAFNQEKALVGAFSVLTNLRMELFQAPVQDSRVIQRTRHGAALRIKMLGNPWNGETGAQGVQVC